MNTRTTLTLALAAAIGAAGFAHASSPFAMQSLKSGYMVAAADDKVMEGKATDATGTEAKAKDGKCSTGKCGANKARKAKAKKAAKAHDGKCGANMDKGKSMDAGSTAK